MINGKEYHKIMTNPIMHTKTLVVHSNQEEEYFFSTDHCQPNTPKGFVPTSFRLPVQVTERAGVENGLIDTFEKFKIVHLSGWGDKKAKEISNPNTEYSPKIEDIDFDFSHYFTN